MLKTYYDGLEWYDYLVFLVYNGIITYLLYSIGDVFFRISKKTLQIFLLLFQVYFFVIIIDSFFDFLPYLSDTQYFSFMISSGQYPQASPDNVLAAYYLSIPLALISLNNPVIFTFINMGIFIIALFILLKTWKKNFPDQYIITEKIFPFICLILPCLFLFNTAPLISVYVLLGFVLFLCGYLNCIYNNKWISLITGSFIWCAFDFQAAYFVVPFLLLVIILKLRISKLSKISLIAITIILVIVCLRYFIIQEALSPEKLSELRNMNVEKGGQFSYGIADWNTYTEMLTDNMFYIFQFLASPLPLFIQHDVSKTIYLLLDAILFLFVFLLALFNIKNIYGKYKSVIFLLLLYILAFGSYEHTLIGAIERRIPVFLLLILMCIPVFFKVFTPKSLVHE